MEPVLEAIPDPDEAEDRRMFEEAAEHFRQMGIASAHLAKADVERLEMLQRMHRDGELPLRLYVMADGGDAAIESHLDGGPRHDDDAWLSMRAIKHFADGALGSGGALLMESDREGNRGLEVTPPDDLCRRAERLAEGGWQMAVHAIGDRAARNVLDAFESIPSTSRERLRPRLEHAQMLTEPDRARLSELSAIASIQPIHLRSDAAWADDRLHDSQLDRLFPWPDLSDHAVLAAGSDYPIEDPNPWHGVATALTRRTADGRRFQPERALSRSSILAAYTTGAAHAAHWEDELGRLDPGFAADVVALDCDPLRAAPEAIWSTEVLETWIAGEPVSAT
jgi:predicted amidohydrolase YtcJ